MTKPAPGTDYIGVGVGAIVVNDAGELFLSQRGEAATNERGAWEFPAARSISARPCATR